MIPSWLPSNGLFYDTVRHLVFKSVLCQDIISFIKIIHVHADACTVFLKVIHIGHINVIAVFVLHPYGLINHVSVIHYRGMRLFETKLFKYSDHIVGV